MLEITNQPPFEVLYGIAMRKSRFLNIFSFNKKT